MRHTILFSLFAVLSPIASFGQCSETDRPRVLLVGDSWAFFMGVDGTINDALTKWGHSDKEFITNLVVAENGAETDDFLTASKQNAIQQLIDDNPTIDIVHLSIGGNDVLGDWHVSFTQQATDSLKQAVFGRLIQVIDFIKSTRPGMRILWSGYAYPNFGEVIGELPSFLQSVHPFYGTWEDMGFPSFEQLNVILNDFSAQIEAYAANDPQVDFVNATGLMQYTHGQSSPLAVPPGGSYPPYTVPLPAGNVLYPSPKSSMRNYGLFLDCFHLSAQGYADLIEYHTQKFYHKFLMHDAWSLSEGNGMDGSVTDAGGTSPLLALGMANGERSGTVLSFQTSVPSGQQVSAASIFLRRSSLTGTNPIGSTLQVKVINGHFGTSAMVEAADWSAAGDAEAPACRFGSNGGDGHWIRIDLPVQLLSHIATDGRTQFLITDPNGTNGRVTFNDASDPDFAPVLDLTFAPMSVHVAEVSPRENGRIHPNPTNGMLFINTTIGTPVVAEVHDIAGRVALRTTTTGSLDLSALPMGTYILRVQLPEGPLVRTVVRQ
jgi:lysophospholipase L1-like esterase